MKIGIDRIVSLTLMKLDVNEEIIREKESFGIPGTQLVDLIEDLIEEVVASETLAAPLSSLSNWEDGCSEVEWEGPGRGYVELPEDFLRLARFKMSDWARAVNVEIEYGSRAYDWRFGRRSLNCGNYSPAVAIRGGNGVKVLEFIGSTSPGAYVEVLDYIRVPGIDFERKIEIPRSLLPKIIDSLVAKVRAIQCVPS